MPKSQDIVMTPETARRVSAAVKGFERMTSGSASGNAPPRPIAYVKLCVVTVQVNPRVASTCGTGTVQPYLIKQDKTLVPTGPTVEIVNWTGNTYAVGTLMEFNVKDGFISVNGNDCSGVAL